MALTFNAVTGIARGSIIRSGLEIRQWDNFALKSSIASMPRFWQPKPRQNESPWQTPRIGLLEPSC